MGKSNWRVLIGLPAAGMILALGLTACSDDNDDANGAGSLTPTQQVSAAWDLFESGDCVAAHDGFTAAIGRDASLADAYSGAGWALGRIPGRLQDAPARFSQALQRDTTRYDALGGWAFAAYQLGDYRSAIQKSDSLLRRRPGWRFLHEQTLDESDMLLLQAAAYYNLGEYNNSYQVVVGQLNPTFEADVATAGGRRELLDEIERLRRIYG